MDQQLKKFLQTKRDYEQKGWTANYIFETTYYEDLKTVYGTKMLALEKKLDTLHHIEPGKLGTFLMCGRHAQKTFIETTTGIKIIHLASGTGFSRGNMGLIEEESSEDVNQVKAERFERAFKRVVSNKELCPDDSLLILSVEQQKLLERAGKVPRVSVSSSAKKRQSARLKNQPRIDEFFKSDKPRPAMEKPYKKPEPAPKYNIETILTSLRGDKVRILWLPKSHYELDPSKYVAVFLLNEISQRLEREEEVEGEEAKTLRDLCAEGVDVLPNDIWTKIVELVDEISDEYLQDENRDDNQPDEGEDNTQDENSDNEPDEGAANQQDENRDNNQQDGTGGDEQDNGGDSEQDKSTANEQDKSTANASSDNTANEQNITIFTAFTVDDQQEEIM